MNYFKILQRFAILLLPLSLINCTTVKYYPTNFVESLKHPTKFPDVFSSTVQNIEDVAAKNPLGENEEIKITDVGENKNSSMHLMQVRENGELRPHYHKQHDEVIYVKKGSGIATLDNARYIVKPGSILQIPSKTVHKFLNTGGEQFVAVSIFSPPFDGRDEKKIKERKKTDRSTKEEKRLASKKPETVTPKEAVPSEKSSAKSVDEEVKTDTNVVKSETIAEKSLDKPIKKSPDIATKSTSEGKKKPKKIKPAEEPLVNIEDLHKKLSKLLELKEEGTISAEEYEEKKDALIKGKDTGELPESKGIVKNKAPIAAEESIVEHTEKQTTTDTEKSVSTEEDTVVSTPNTSDETEPSTPEVESIGDKELLPEDKPNTSEVMEQERLITEEENKSPYEDKLKALDEMKQEGLISEEDYEIKKEALIGLPAGKTISMPSENSNNVIEPPPNEGESIEKIESQAEDKLKALDEMKQEGLITEEDYETKKKTLIGASEEKPIPMPSESTSKDKKINNLKELY